MHDRYHRQVLLAGFGEGGQRRLAESHAVIVGCGALGCSSADMLARAGVGRLTLIDRDVVEPTNLQRQVLFDERHARAGDPKAVAAAGRLAEINSGVRTDAVVADLTASNAERLILGESRPGVIVDGTDNFETRFLINDVAVRHGLAYAYAGAVGTRAATMTVLPGETPCLRCVFNGPPPAGSEPTCESVGVLGAVIAAVTGVQVTEALKVLLGRGDLVRRSLVEFDVWRNTRREIDVSGLRGPACPCCVGGRFEFLERVGTEPASLCGRDAVQVTPGGAGRVDLGALAGRLGAYGGFTVTRYLVRGSLESERTPAGGAVGLTVFADGRAIIQGVDDPGRARGIYARYVGS